MMMVPVMPETPPSTPPDPQPTPMAGAAPPLDVPDAAADAAPSLPDAGTDPPVLDEPGAPFSPCTQNGDCDTGLACTASVPWMAAATGYCTAFCGPGGVTADACPQPSSGLVKAACQFSTLLCELDSCERSQCPKGMRCIASEQPIGGGQVVEVYRCQR